MARDHGPEWLADVAALINETVRKLEAIGYFRHAVRQWYQEYLASECVLDEWKRRRNTHGKRLSTEALLRQHDPVPGEAEKADEYWFFVKDFAYEDDGEPKWVAGWVPAVLLNEPGAELPLPVTERKLSMPERYAVAAAVNDVVLPFDPFNPWHDSPPWWEHEDKKHMPEIAFAVLKSSIRKLQDADRLAIKIIVDAVLADLRKRSDAPPFHAEDLDTQRGGYPARTEAPTLTIDSGKREILWNSMPLSINQTSTFDVLRSLHGSAGAVVPYSTLLGVIKPTCVAASVEISEAPPELKPIITRIRNAFKAVGCNWTIRSVPRIGYQLLPSRN